MSDASLPIALRPIREEDLPFVTDTWLRSYRETNFAVPHDQYMETQRRVIKLLLRSSRIAVACDPDDSDQIFGYAVWRPGPGRPLLHWAFVKQPFRRLGVFRRLLTVVDPDSRGVVLTHRSIHYQELRQAFPQLRQMTFALISCLVEEAS